MKKFAIFLPQFHTIPENDEWWGKGFTEWTNLKNAKPLFKGHIQPKHPLDNNYYDLLSKETVIWQTDLLDKYNIDGLIYYHYYFQGKLLLEKPAENLLKWKDIHQCFFFCWANHSWIRSWNGSKKVLMEQTYGSQEDWEKHFQYLLPFFKDDRYEKKDNKPLFMIFKSSFNEKNDIFNYFNSRCIDEGFDGIFLIESYHGEISINQFKNEMSSITSMIYYREPAVSQFMYFNEMNKISKIIKKGLTKLRNRNILKKPYIISGEKLMRLKIKNTIIEDNIAQGIWFEWDNTSRHKQRGYIISSYDKKIFDEYMQSISECEYLFINAWNEWCEGMVLEPTEEDKYKYLEWINEWNEGND